MSLQMEVIKDDGVSVSVRDITEEERKLLTTEMTADPCQGSNAHILQLDNELPSICSLFSHLQVTSIALGGEHVLILTSDKKLFSYGSNEFGQLGIGDTKSQNGICCVLQTNGIFIKHMSCGARHSAVLSEDGTLFCWGDSREGQCGTGGKGIFTTPAKVIFPPSTSQVRLIKDVSCAELFTACIDSRGAVWTWGKGDGLGHGDTTDQCDVPKLVKGLRKKKAIQIVCGSFHCVVITQEDYEGTPYSPNYRTESVSSSYYTELQVQKDSNVSRVPFLQSTFYSCDNVDSCRNLAGLQRSHSDTDINNIKKHEKNVLEENVSVSEIDLREAQLIFSIGEESNTLNLIHDGISSPDAPSTTSSRYYSAIDVTPNILSSSEPSISSPKSDKITYSLRFNESLESNVQDDESIFEGKKSLFETISKTTTASLKTLKSFSIVSDPGDDDENIKNTTIYGSLEVVVSTQVWSWGKNVYGQLGHDDHEERVVPSVIEKLSGKNVLLVAAGSYHTLAVTAHGQVYSWGDNTFGQIGQSKTVIYAPKKMKILTGMRMWDAAAGRNFSMFLGDTERSHTDVYFCGEVESRQKLSRSISNPIVEIQAVEKKKADSRWRLSRRNRRNFDGSISPSLIDVVLRKMTHLQKNEVAKCLTAKDYSFGCVTEKFREGSKIEPIYKFARAERLFLYQLSLIHKTIMEPLICTDGWFNITKESGGESLIPLVDSFIDLIHAITTELTHLTYVVKYSLPSQELFSYLFSDSFRAAYDRYSQCYSDALAVGVITSCNKPASGIISKLKDVMKSLEKNLSLTHTTFEDLLKAPLMRCHVYCDIAKRISSHCESSTEIDHLKEVISRWLTFSDVCSKRLIMANMSKKFWNESHTKVAEALKDPQRRVIKSSKTDPLGLSRASRLSSHSYILCNDVFVHVQFNRNFHVFPLVTLWADSVPDADYAQNAIKITTPEESFTLSAGTPAGKIAWLTELNQAIASCLSAYSSLSLGLAVNSSSGLLKAAVAREASYLYVNHPVYKSASYKGMWLAGVPHGRGNMTWEDGSCYEGEFVNGQFHGHGQMTWPKTSTNTNERLYDGEWVEGQMCGHGCMRYGQGEDYTGNFKDGVRQGHGTLKTSSNKTSLDTIYVGNWVNDMKSGYGVLDFIIRGEKYMGMWAFDQRHGHGVVVTVDGVYYEGDFFQNRLAGRGILLSEDDTCYEGEFTADMLLSGKGVLTLPNGDNISGSFYGNWGDSIKVNGVFAKFTNPLIHDSTECSHSNRLGTTDFTIDADIKWSSLFQECLQTFGCDGISTDIPAKEAWKNVNEAVMKTGLMMPKHPSSDGKFDLKDVFALANNLRSLQEYLSGVFDTTGHPLNTLVEGLVEVYRATYVGVGAHRRLLPHAVAEAKSYVTRIFNVLRKLFPDLHDEEFVMLSNDTPDGVVDTPINSMSLLHPLLLPRLYPPLFTLYALLTEKTDAVYTEKLYYLNKRGDIALLSFLGVRKKFWLLHRDEGKSDEVTKESVNRAYVTAIETLEHISTTYSPMGKIEIIRRTFAKIHEEIESYFKDERQILAMDDLFPLFQYIVIRARVPHLGSEIRFIEDLVEESILVGEAGHMVTTLSACYFQIQNERDRD